jgi:predicted deacetylase
VNIVGASFIWRMDDITPGMNWEAFNRYIDLFHHYHVKPLLGVVPDNKDPQLDYGAENPDFWPILRQLKKENLVEISQHGYQHTYVTRLCGLAEKYGVAPQSEFAGLPYAEQFAKITAGQQILRREKLESDIWMAPGHTFDEVTLKALAAAGFRAITDGLALYPYMMEGLIFVPQQAWFIQKAPFGYITIGMHVNYAGENHFHDVEKILKTAGRSISFSEARTFQCGIVQSVINNLFQYCYCPLIKRLRDVKRQLSRA